MGIGTNRECIYYTASSKGRGNRAAGWFADYLSDQGDVERESLVLAGGIKHWVAGGLEYTQWMDEYEELAWLGK